MTPAAAFNLMAHQSQGVQIARTMPRFCFFWEPGAGKTALILAIVEDQKSRGFQGKTLVLAPKSILYSAWAADARHFPGISLDVVWHQNPMKRRKMIADSTADIIVTNYETFRRHAEEFLAAGVRRLVVDESSRIKNIKAQISTACFDFSHYMDSVYLLSGTPAPNSQTEYFGQIRCVDPRLFGGVQFYKFAFNYFTPIRRFIHEKERIIGWNPIESKQAEFLQKLSSVSWSVRKQDCMDLPPQTDVIREVVLSPEEQGAYDAMLEELRVELPDGDVIDARTNGRMMKLRQLTGGMIIDGDRSAKIIGRSKLIELGELLDELEGRPVVIWAQFTADINRIRDEILGRGAAVAIIDGREADPRVRSATVEMFQNGTIQYLVCHPAAAGHGLTLTRAAESIFYSWDYDPGLHEQARDRIHRKGQDQKTTYYYLRATGTIDEKMFWVLKRKKSVSDATKEILHWLRAGTEGVAA